MIICVSWLFCLWYSIHTYSVKPFKNFTYLPINCQDTELTESHIVQINIFKKTKYIDVHSLIYYSHLSASHTEKR